MAAVPQLTPRLWSPALLLGSVLALAVPASAQIVWNPTSDFSTTNGNPNGVWTYGWMDTGFTTFTPYTNHGANNWYGWGSDQSPAVWLNTSTSTSYGVPPGYLSIHPGNGTEPSILRWTAPATYPGLTNFTGQFLSGDGGTMQVAVRQNGTVLWSGTDSGSFNLNVAIGANDVVDFAVFGGYFYGNTPLQLTITAVPEPTVWMMLGVSVVPLALRRKHRRRR